MKLNVPSGLAVTESTSVLLKSYKLTVTGLLASTCPVSIAKGKGVGEASGVVNIGVGEATGVNVSVGVGDSTGIAVNIGVEV